MTGAYIQIRGYEVSTNIDNNTSQVRFQLFLSNGDQRISNIPCTGFIEYDNGKRLTYSGTIDMQTPNQTKALIDQEVTIAHDGDGTRTVVYRGELHSTGGSNPINTSIPGRNYALTTISRASYGADVTAEIAKPVTINITKREAWMRHSIWVRVGDWEQKIAGDNIDTSYTWTPPIDIANQFPNSTSGTGTIAYISYADGIERGRDIRKITVSVPTNLFKPGFTGFNLSDTNPVTQNLIPSPTHFVSTLSRIKVAFDGARGTAGASITGYYAEIVSGNTSAQTNGGVLTVPTTMTDKQMTVRAKVQDSRGVWSDWAEKTITVLAYFNPTLRFEAKRTGEKLDTITLKRFLKVAALSVNGTQKNTTKLTFKTRKVGADTYTTDSTNEWQNISELNGSDANLNGKYPADTSWEVLGRVEDKFSYTEFVITVSTDKVVMSYERDGVGIGKYREMGALDVNGLIYSDRKQIQHHKLTEPNGVAIDNKVANLNDYRTTGFYSIQGNYKNHPASGEGAYLEVVESISGYHQTLTTVSGRMFKRTVTSNSNGSWIEYTPKPEKEEKPEPPFIKRTVDFGWGVRAFFVKKGSVVTASLFRDANEVGVYEYGKMDNNTIPEGFRPSTEVHLVANKNIGTGHAGVAVWHLASDGSIRLTNQSKDRAIYSGTVTYITEDN
jgi:ORF39